MTVRRRWSTTGLLLALALCGCGDGPLTPAPIGPGPPGSSAGPAPAKPVNTFLDARVAVCPTAAELATVSDVRLELIGVAASRPVVCRASEGSADMTYHQRKLRQALILMKELRFDAPLPWTNDRTLWDWFRGLGVGMNVVMDDTNATCCGGDRMIHLTVGSTTAEPALAGIEMLHLIGFLIHEARHIQVGHHPCQRIFDNRISDLGAYGSENVYIQFLARHSDPTQVPLEYRPYFLWVACSHRGARFCQEPQRPCETQ